MSNLSYLLHLAPMSEGFLRRFWTEYFKDDEYVDAIFEINKYFNQPYSTPSCFLTAFQWDFMFPIFRQRYHDWIQKHPKFHKFPDFMDLSFEHYQKIRYNKLCMLACLLH
jgi:hypothetical protein